MTAFSTVHSFAVGVVRTPAGASFLGHHRTGSVAFGRLHLQQLSDSGPTVAS